METYLIGLLIILVVILIGLVYFMSKQVRENDTKLKINIKDLEALRNKVLELDNILRSQMHQQQPLNFNNGMFEEEKVDLDADFDIVENNDLVNESDSDESVDVDEVNLEEDNVLQDVETEVVSDEVVDTEEEETEEVVNEEDVVDVVADEAVSEEETDVVQGEELLETGENVSTPEETENDSEIEDVTDKVETLLARTKKIRFKQPSSKAKEFDVGHRMESDHDGQTYEVVLDSRNRPRWKRIAQ